MSCLLLTRLLDDAVSANENSCQGRSPLNAKSEYGIPSDDTFASRPRTTVKITVVATGCKIAQAPPSSVCL